MKNIISKTLVLMVLAGSMTACGTNMTTKQRNTVIGAAVGAAAGNFIGGDTGSTLGGAALGGVIGSQMR